jgi:hypothetical protein
MPRVRLLLIALLADRSDIQIVIVSSKFNSMAASPCILKVKINHSLS